MGSSMKPGTIIAAMLMIAAIVPTHAVGANTGDSAGGNVGGSKSAGEGMAGKSATTPFDGSTSVGAWTMTLKES
jgi:hypothetical protein